jgi:two-component system, sensor histidine kinase
MGGSIGAESRPGSGSTFRVEVSLPRAEARAVEADDDFEDDAEPGPETTSLSVLVVDDNPVNLMVMGQILTALGHQPVTADSGAFALEVAAATPFDMILMDIQMPGMTGIEALERLQGAEGPNRRTPVLAVTADVLTRADGDFRALGFAGHVSKPVQIGLLVAAMAEAGSEAGASEEPGAMVQIKRAVNA